MKKYEKPHIELIVLEIMDVITLSGEESGSGNDQAGPWG